jgi:hypothetical protein
MDFQGPPPERRRGIGHNHAGSGIWLESKADAIASSANKASTFLSIFFGAWGQRPTPARCAENAPSKPGTFGMLGERSECAAYRFQARGAVGFHSSLLLRVTSISRRKPIITSFRRVFGSQILGCAPKADKNYPIK